MVTTSSVFIDQGNRDFIRKFKQALSEGTIKFRTMESKTLTPEEKAIRSNFVERSTKIMGKYSIVADRDVDQIAEEIYHVVKDLLPAPALLERNQQLEQENSKLSESLDEANFYWKRASEEIERINNLLEKVMGIAGHHVGQSIQQEVEEHLVKYKETDPEIHPISPNNNGN